RVVALERSAGAVETELRRRGGGATGDHSLRVAVAAAILRSAVERGDPFTAELKVAQGLAAEPPMLAPLEEFAGSGMPSAAARASAGLDRQGPGARDGGGGEPQIRR